MWVRKEEWNRMKERVADLEKKIPKTDSFEPLNFTVYDQETLSKWRSAGLYSYHTEIPQQQVSVKDAIQRILSHLGLELSYVKGTPAAVVLQKQKRNG